MHCACGGECREHTTKGGSIRVVTCNACGRRESFERRAVAEGEMPTALEKLTELESGEKA